MIHWNTRQGKAKESIKRCLRPLVREDKSQSSTVICATSMTAGGSSRRQDKTIRRKGTWFKSEEIWIF